MDRLAIIIKGFSKNEIELRLDLRLVKDYINFLKSTAGGAWDLEQEMIVLEDPTIERLEQIVEEGSPQFVLLIMIGHGATQDSKQLFQFNESTIIQAGQLAFDVDKQLVILESCRTHANGKIKTVDLKDRTPGFKYGGLVRRPRTKEESRNIYMRIVEECSNGLVICYPCSDNELAEGFYFSIALLRRSFEWHLLNHSRYFPITQLIEVVSKVVFKITKEKQTPVISGTIGFPFAISKF
jgi:hypothetical protein